MIELKGLTDAEIEARMDGDPRIRKVRTIDGGLIGIVQSKVTAAWIVRFGPYDTGRYFAHSLAWADAPLPQAEPKGTLELSDDAYALRDWMLLYAQAIELTDSVTEGAEEGEALNDARGLLRFIEAKIQLAMNPDAIRELLATKDAK